MAGGFKDHATTSSSRFCQAHFEACSHWSLFWSFSTRFKIMVIFCNDVVGVPWMVKSFPIYDYTHILPLNQVIDLSNPSSQFWLCILVHFAKCCNFSIIVFDLGLYISGPFYNVTMHVRSLPSQSSTKAMNTGDVLVWSFKFHCEQMVSSSISLSKSNLCSRLI